MKFALVFLILFLPDALVAQKPDVEKLISSPTQLISYSDKPIIEAVRYSLSVTPGSDVQPTTFNIEVKCNDLLFDSVGGNWVGRFLINLHITGKTATVGYLEGDYKVERNQKDLVNVSKCAPLLISRRVLLAPGNYKVEALARDIGTDGRRRKAIKFRVKSQ